MSWSIAAKQDADRAGLARDWRDSELEKTDWIVSIADHPQHTDYLTYRVALRAWPADAGNFPATKPVLGE
tara:strand:- start:272 stop:481 length:210 start_codon:yes stop_codon:yes gene_type:complete